MIKHTIILGHGSGDPGAKGVGNYTERGMLEKFAKQLRSVINTYKLPVQIISDHNVLRKGDVTKYWGTSVTELHYNAFNGSANGCEVLIHADLPPDAMDARILKSISNYFTNRGCKKRRDLGNMNRAYRFGVNYRLVEICFIDNIGDVQVMDRDMGPISIGLLKAITNQEFVAPPSKPIPPPPKTKVTLNVQTGSFTERANAEKHLIEVRKHFPNAFIKEV